MIFCPSATGDSPCLTPKAAKIAAAASGVAPLALQHVLESFAVAQLDELLARGRVVGAGRLGDVGDILRDHAHFDRSEGRAGLTLPTVA